LALQSRDFTEDGSSSDEAHQPQQRSCRSQAIAKAAIPAELE
jgi:hypothetical protein